LRSVGDVEKLPLRIERERIRRRAKQIVGLLFGPNRLDDFVGSRVDDAKIVARGLWMSFSALRSMAAVAMMKSPFLGRRCPPFSKAVTARIRFKPDPGRAQFTVVTAMTSYTEGRPMT